MNLCEIEEAFEIVLIRTRKRLNLRNTKADVMIFLFCVKSYKIDMFQRDERFLVTKILTTELPYFHIFP